MNEQIMEILSDYLTVYTNYRDKIENELLLRELTTVYNELLELAEKKAHNYADFMQKFTDSKLEDRFKQVVNKCKSELDAII